MIETLNPEINVDELMARIREEAARLPDVDFSRSAPMNIANATSSLAFALPRAPREPAFTISETYTLADFLNAHDEAFIRRAYRGILGREPDAGGLQNYLQQLRSGRVDKVEILGRLRYSLEGRAKAVKVGGLLPSFVVATVCRLPLLGYLLRLLIGLLRLPTLVRNFTCFENHTVGRLDNVRDQFNQGMESCEQSLAELNVCKADARLLMEALARIEALERQLEAFSKAPQEPMP